VWPGVQTALRKLVTIQSVVILNAGNDCLGDPKRTSDCPAS